MATLQINTQNDDVIERTNKADGSDIRGEDFDGEAGGSKAESGEAQEITRLHWVPKKNRSSCFNPSCKKRFTLLRRKPHNCRRCGDVFCGPCLQHSLLLNSQAQPDLDGKRYKVCKSCHDYDRLIEVDGYTRSRTDYFKSKRSKYKERALLERAPEFEPEEVLNWMHSKLDLERECERLLSGFEQAVGKSQFKLARIEAYMSSQKWQRPNLWIMRKAVKSCQVCEHSFGVNRKRSYCRVCGLPLCKSSGCSDKDLLLYIPDKDGTNNTLRKPKLGIIKFDGCPGVEPIISLRLRVCLSCKELLKKRQFEDYQSHEEGGHVLTNRLFVEDFKTLNAQIQAVENQVEGQLSMLIKTVELLEAGEREVTQATMKELEDIVANVSAHLQQHLTKAEQLIKLEAPAETTNSKLLKNYNQVKTDFYFDSKSKLTAIELRLGDCIPAGSFDAIRRMMQQDPLRGAHVYMHQLVIETTRLREEYRIVHDVPLILQKVVTAIVHDMEEAFKDKTDDKKKQILASVVQTARDRAEENKLIRPSQLLLNKPDKIHIYNLMYEHVEYILKEINDQIHLLSYQPGFQHTKDALTIALEEIQEHKGQDHVVQTAACCTFCRRKPHPRAA